MKRSYFESEKDITSSTLLSLHFTRDRDLNTFALAEGAFYHFGLLCTPTRARALLNWALVLEHVRRDPAQAGERTRRCCFRRVGV